MALIAAAALGCAAGGDPLRARPGPTVDMGPDGGAPIVDLREATTAGAGTLPIAAWLVGGCCAVTTHPVVVGRAPDECPAGLVSPDGGAPAWVCATDRGRPVAVLPRPANATPGAALSDESIFSGQAVLLRSSAGESPGVLGDVTQEQFTVRADRPAALGPSWRVATVLVFGRAGGVLGVAVTEPDPRTGLAQALRASALGALLDDCRHTPRRGACASDAAPAVETGPPRARAVNLLAVILSALPALALAAALFAWVLRRSEKLSQVPLPQPPARDVAPSDWRARYARDGLPETLAVSAGGGPVYVVSDLHVGAGLHALRYNGTENFFVDEAFARWLRHVGRENAVLVLNGDVFDFLRVVDTPTLPDAREAWDEMLCALAAPFDATSESTLVAGARDRLGKLKGLGEDQTYGLGTEDYKSVWKLRRIAAGHTAFFAALARWVADGRRVLVNVGNHDIEWHWALVRRCFVQCVARASDGALRAEDVAAAVSFSGRAIVVDDELYIEHGHRYDTFAATPGYEAGKPSLPLPAGSIFNRYILNKIELAYPYLDNVRPSDGVFALLVRERFPLAMRLVFHHLPKALLKLRHSPRFLLLWLGLAVVVAAPVALFFVLLAGESGALFEALRGGAGAKAPLIALLGAAASRLGVPALGYVTARLFTALTLREPSSLNAIARRHFERAPPPAAGRSLPLAKLRVFTCGHTHDPEVCAWRSGKTFFNTGTWIDIVEVSSAQVRVDRACTFLEVSWRDGRAEGALRRWNDDAGRDEPALTVARSPGAAAQ